MEQREKKRKHQRRAVSKGRPERQATTTIDQNSSHTVVTLTQLVSFGNPTKKKKR
jgi:hypothetical protein